MTVGDGQIRCDGCGTELNPEAKFCKSCGRSTSAAVDSPLPGRNRTHPCVVAGRGVESYSRDDQTHWGWTLGRRTSEPFTKLCSFDTDVAIDIDREWRPLFQPEERKVGGCGRHSRRCDHRWNRHPSAFEAFSNECNRFLFFTHEHNWRFRYKSSAEDNVNNHLVIDLDDNYCRIRQCGGTEDQFPPCSELKRPQCNRHRDK